MSTKPLIVSRRSLAEILNLSERRITQLVTAGVLPARGLAGFDLAASVRGYIAFLGTHGGDLKTERTRCAKLKADLLQLQVKERTGELVEKAEVEREQFTLYRRVRDGLQNIPSRVSGIVAAELDQAKIFQILTKEIHQTLTALADALDPAGATAR